MELPKYFKWALSPLILLIFPIGFCIYMAWGEYKVNNVLVEKAFSGNLYAVQILTKYKKPSELDKRVVYSALDGNEYALEILQISKERPAENP